MSGTRIDVVIPAYQAERWLAAAIESVLAQRDAPLGEVIVVDNGSSDGTGRIARGFGAPVRCLTTGPTGSGHARNVGIQAAGAALLAFLDADDLMVAGGLEARRRALEESGADLVAGLVLPFRDGQPLPADPNAPSLRPWTQRAQLGGSLLIRRSAFDRVGLLDETLRGPELTDWLMRASAAGSTPVMLERVVLLRRLHPHSLTPAAMAQVTAGYLKILRRHLQRQGSGKP